MAKVWKDALVKGEMYKKSDFGIRPPNTRRTDQLVQGEFYSFFNMADDRGRDNELQDDGFVYGVNGNEWALIEPGQQTLLRRRIFIHEDDNAPGEFTYIGETTREERYKDENRNKAYF
ncbi:MAG: hypothetical protein LBQ94_11810 [Treponema sp.]|jgi:hypothetical protein|nr:hypothetical protein [Treponema sp.]